ncbi:PD-(D/E)XK nuclease family protein [Hydrogenimonas thermophila]|uniref:PD-(D/E)XK nuclease family protein n=1 Tax=Hydrogenimonas thermophila TaxID=223786 RepID=UPI002937176A|nr:PD-(D/E)XK nuclease family protein [Hydrogenimonas thermophila]WOE70753.1 PD-(D/E)XK nuclease family protein [Hydrogenimonas thermophila]WOE73271.1 PD-(D/E)XK nuclease family protein [Hydrogenimonas thermophila]
MKCLVFSTHRQVRDFISQHDNTILPKLYTIDEFLKRCVVVPEKVFVDKSERILYLYKAAKSVDIGKLGFDKNFLSFIQNSSFIFRFYEEIFAEQVDIDTIRSADTYADFEDHLVLLKELFYKYKELLEEEGLVDKITIENFRIAETFLEQFEEIELFVEGYLSRFEIGVLQRLKVPLKINFAYTPFNKKLIDRLGIDESLPIDYSFEFDWQRKKIINKILLPKVKRDAIEVSAFEERINQVAFVLKKVEQFIEDGANPDNVAVIVPDESFSEYLKLFDSVKNFNYAMGTPFVQSSYYRRLADLYDALTDAKESAKAKIAGSDIANSFEQVDGFESFIEFLQNLPSTAKELEIIDEELFMFKRFAPLLEGVKPLHLLHSWLQRLEDKQIDDVGGGRITVMGVLESRGKEFDGVVIVDFNEDIVPKVDEKDLFLNSTIRKHAGMPTRKDKENLQKNYYYRLLQNSKRVAISYVKNEESLPSRFLFELGLKESKVQDELYRAIIAPSIETPKLEDVPIVSKNLFLEEPKLTPSRLKDYLVCLRRFYYKYQLKIENEVESGDVNIGTLIHSALEEAVKQKDMFNSHKDYHAFVMDTLYKSTTSPLQRFEISLEWEPKLQKFCEIDFESLKSFKQECIEKWCSNEYFGFELSSKIDRVDLGETVVRLIDYKTTKNIDNTVKDENDFQLLFYRLWAEANFPNRRIETIYWDIYGSKEVKVDTTPKKEQLAEIVNELKQRKEIDFTKTDDIKACKYCDYKVACGRDV